MANDPEAGRKLRQAIETYATEQIGQRPLNALDAVLETFVPEEAMQNEIRSLLIDLVFRYLFAAARMHFNSDSPGSVDERLDRFLTRHTRLTGETLTNFRKRLKQAILTAEAARPKSERKDRIRQKQHQYFCYLCGEEIGNDDEQLDHVWPQSAGGGTGKENLRRAHAACQILKHDLAVPGDAAMGRFAFHGNLPRQLKERARRHWEENVDDPAKFVSLMDDIRASSLRMALILRQDGRCHFCKQEFRKIGPLQLVRLEQDLPWWLPNAAASCSGCTKGEVYANL